MPAGAGEDEIERILKDHPGFKLHTSGRSIERLIIVPGRIVSVVTT